MCILDTAISAEGGVGKLAGALGVRQSVVSNWRKRGLPRPWKMVLDQRYGAPVAANDPATALAQRQEVAHA